MELDDAINKLLNGDEKAARLALKEYFRQTTARIISEISPGVGTKPYSLTGTTTPTSSTSPAPRPSQSWEGEADTTTTPSDLSIPPGTTPYSPKDGAAGLTVKDTADPRPDVDSIDFQNHPDTTATPAQAAGGRTTAAVRGFSSGNVEDRRGEAPMTPDQRIDTRIDATMAANRRDAESEPVGSDAALSAHASSALGSEPADPNTFDSAGNYAAPEPNTEVASTSSINSDPE